ncbi:MAG TPA: DNA recombination protein RmuC, partial [Segetibacter sp.]|nr:DNA recombination protein RmuC [Segetibacter sp.]
EKFKNTREKLNNQQNDILRLRERFTSDFSELAKRLLDNTSKKFSESNEQSMRQFLVPLKNNINEFRQKVEEIYDKESKKSFSAGKEVVRAIDMSHLIIQEANNVTTALKANDKLPRNLGQKILESLLSNSGLTKGKEYFLREFIRDNAGNIIKDENGKELQPDVTICYPDKRKLIIDSKVSLLAWNKYINCDDKAQQRLFLQDHIRSLRLHIDTLSKNYPKYLLGLDYVLLFIPSKRVFLRAVKTDLQLRKYADEKGILLVSPTNLYAVLKIVADYWIVEQQYQNALHIAEKANALYGKFTGFIDNMECVGKKLEDATNFYTEAFKALSSGR